MMCLPKFINRMAIFFAMLLWFFALNNSLSAETVDRVVANVNGEIITLSSVRDRFIIISKNNNASNNGDQLQLERELMQNALNSIIEERLQVQEAKKSGFVVSEESINKALDEIKKNNNITDQQYETLLENEGRSLDAYKKVLRDQILASRIIRMQMGKNLGATKKQIKAYYIKHQKDYWEPPKVKARHILFILENGVSSKEIKLKTELAREVLKKIHAGKDFAKLAKIYSEDVSAHLGGDVGIIEKGAMVREIEEVAFRLRAGEVSNIVTTRYGLHIIKCEEIFPGLSKPLNQVKEKIGKLLRSQNEQKAYQKWVRNLKENAYIEVSLFKDPLDDFADNKNVLESKAVGLTDDESKNAIKTKRPQKASKSTARQWELMKNGDSRNYKLIINKLKYYKKMRESKKISVLEYQEKKKELLKSF